MPSRKNFSTTELTSVYLKAGLLAGAAGFVIAWLGTLLMQAMRLFCEPVSGDVGDGMQAYSCPDGIGYTIPALILAILGGTIAFWWVLHRDCRQADVSTLQAVGRHILWIVVSPVNLVLLGLLPIFLTASASSGWQLVRVLAVLLALLFVNIPLVAAHKFPSQEKQVLTVCLVALALATLAFGLTAILILPLAVLLICGWTVTLVFWQPAHKLHVAKGKESL